MLLEYLKNKKELSSITKITKIVVKPDDLDTLITIFYEDISSKNKKYVASLYSESYYEILKSKTIVLHVENYKILSFNEELEYNEERLKDFKTLYGNISGLLADYQTNQLLKGEEVTIDYDITLV